jgi:hypothetical protein
MKNSHALERVQMEKTMAAVLEENVAQAEMPVASTPQATHHDIEVRAYFRYMERGYVDGCALDDWLTAEAELREGQHATASGS